MIDAVERLWKEGLVVVAAAGNNGPERGTITVPGCARSIITVGSYDFEGSLNKKSGKIYNYSGRGPTSSCIIKPEILCPGKNIVSLKSNSSGYIAKSGTSMSAPVCTGILSLFVAENSYISNKELKKILYQTSISFSRFSFRSKSDTIPIPAPRYSSAAIVMAPTRFSSSLDTGILTA